jgi:3-hydroxyisobutyrate dehydrogenase-like beta-hydroxyacid dehydrogenase
MDKTATAGPVAIGFVGLGAMGSQLAARLLDGNTLIGTNRTADKAIRLVEQGMIWRDTGTPLRNVVRAPSGCTEQV